MPDPGRLDTQYRRAYRAATVIDNAVDELKAAPLGRIDEGEGDDVGRYLATVAGLVDPALADEIDSDYVTVVPRALVAQLGVLNREQPEFSHRLLDTAHALRERRPLAAAQIELVEQVGGLAKRDALRRTRQILAS